MPLLKNRRNLLQCTVPEKGLCVLSIRQMDALHSNFTPKLESYFLWNCLIFLSYFLSYYVPLYVLLARYPRYLHKNCIPNYLTYFQSYLYMFFLLAILAAAIFTKAVPTLWNSLHWWALFICIKLTFNFYIWDFWFYFCFSGYICLSSLS